MPPELKAVEAELAALLPRDDRLDRERLIFRAGQASVTRPAARGAFARSGWAWPASLAGMTAVAATLLAMLVARPELPERIQFVRVPVEPGSSEVVATAGDTRAQPDSPSAPVYEPRLTAVTSASHGPVWLSYSQSGWFSSRALRLRMLAQGVDLWAPPRMAPVESLGEEAGPLPYREWLKTLLEDRTRAGLPSDWLDLPLKRGANS